MKKVILFSLLIILLSGCSGAVGDDLLRLPKTPKDFIKLQQKIDVLLSSGGEYSPPVSGNNRQVQQTIDLTGNGVSEALVFMRFPGEKSLRIYIYQLIGDDYEELDMISEDAENIDSIHYSDLDGDGLPEVLVGWEVGGGTLKALSVYKLMDNNLDEILSTNFTELSVFDIRGRGQNDLVVLRHDEASFTGSAQLYYIENGEMQSYTPAPFSKGVQSFIRMRTGFLAEGSPALYVASKLEQNALVTDIFTVRDGHFFNVSLNPESEISDETIRNIRIYAADIDSDAIIELPKAYPLPGYEDNADNTEFWYIEWRDYDAYGRIRHKMTTYHSQNDGWYIRLPDRWLGHFTVTSRAVGNTANTTALAYITDLGESVDICVIYCMTGDNRAVQTPDRFYLGEKTDTVYWARLLPDSESTFELTQETLTEMFNLIGNIWITGEIEE